MRAWLLLVAACGGASPELGLDSLVVVPGAQFRPGDYPAPTGGPDTLQVLPLHQNAIIGGTFESVTGILGTSARGAILGIDGATGVWILPAGPPGFENPDNPTVSATLRLADDFPEGPFDILVAGVDEGGKIGEPGRGTIIAADVPPPDGQLVVSLAWDSAADLDLHVVDPNGGEAWSEDPNTIPYGGPGQDPNAFQAGGQLDHDGNAGCRTAGTPNEHVVWKKTDTFGNALPPPPAGTYIVRVDPHAMCGAASASWYVAVTDGTGALIAAVRGFATPDDVTYGKHGLGGGVTALTFTR